MPGSRLMSVKPSKLPAAHHTVLSRRRTSECKCDRLTGHDWRVKPLVNCLLLPTLMQILLGCKAVAQVKWLT